MTMAELINQYAILHDTKKYGDTGDMLSGVVREAIKTHDVESVLDYGCGRSNLVYSLDIDCAIKYDPAIREFSDKPQEKFDLVVCTDVLEHIPEELVEDVIKDVCSYAPLVFFTICTRPAHTILPNGTNAHCLVKSKEWWDNLLGLYFEDIKEIQINPGEGFSVLCSI